MDVTDLDAGEIVDVLAQKVTQSVIQLRPVRPRGSHTIQI